MFSVAMSLYRPILEDVSKQHLKGYTVLKHVHLVQLWSGLNIKMFWDRYQVSRCYCRCSVCFIVNCRNLDSGMHIQTKSAYCLLCFGSKRSRMIYFPHRTDLQHIISVQYESYNAINWHNAVHLGKFYKATYITCTHFQWL